MKRFLSVFLSVCMIMSTVSFAAPFMVNTGINAGEVVETESTENNDATVSAETIKVNFVGDIATEFASINASVGDTLDLSDYLDVEISDSAKAEHKRFNGWMPDGAEKLLTTDTVTVTDADGDGVMYLVALVNHDFNFALEANRDMISVFRGTPNVTDKTIGLTATSTFSQLRIIDGVNGADFEINTNDYKGVSIYYGYNAAVPSDSITSFSSGNFNWLYGVGISADAISTTSTKWTSEPEVCPPRALAGWGSTGTTFMKDFDLVKDASGNVLYCGVPVTVETSTTARKASYSCLEETWPGKTLKSMAMLLRGRNNESWNVRYLRFIPTVDAVKPGINVWTGMNTAYDFENADENALLSKNWPTTFETMASANNENNTAAQIRAAWGYVYKEMPVIERDRPIKISFDYIYGTQIRVVANDNSLVNNLALKTLFYNTAPSGWQSTSSVHYGTTDNITDSLEMSFHTESVDVEKLFFMIFSDPTNGNVYLDNIKVVPGYKVNYNANGGNGSIEPDYFMEGTFSDFADGSALSYEGKVFKGWSLTKGGEVVTSVTGTPGSDVTVYAVWEQLKDIATTVSITAPVAEAVAQTTVSGTGFTGTISWSPALTDGKFVNGTAYTATVTLTVAEGYTAGNVAENGYTVANATVKNTAGATTFTATFAATEAAVAKPGINVWTGTTEAYTFDGAKASDFYAFGGAAFASNGTNSYMEFGGATSHFTLSKSVPVVEKDRPVKVTLKAQVDTADGSKSIFFVRNAMNYCGSNLGLIYTGIPTEWTTYEKTFKGADLAISNASSIFTDDTQDIRQLVLFSQSNCTNNKMRIDDISIIPAYKLTYDVNGGNGSVDPAYFFGSYAALDNGDSLTNGNMMFKGWSLTKGGEVVTSVTGTPGSDVTVYAVWEDLKNIDTTVSITAPKAGETAQTTVEGSGFTGTITWSPALTDGKFAYSTAYTATVTLTVAEGYTAAGVAENGYTVAGATVTNAAGASTFTAAFPATEAAVAKPGLNVWTGTTEAYTFDGAKASDFYAFGGAAFASNGTNSYMEFGGATSHFTLSKSVPVVEKDRPVKVTLKAQVDTADGNKSIFFVRNAMNYCGSNLGLIYTGIPTEWTTYEKTFKGADLAISNASSIFTDDTQDIRQLVLFSQSNCTNNKMRIDDISIIPAYKLTYDVNGGNGSVDPVYFFGNTYSSLADGSALTNGNLEFAGWSLTKDGNAVSSVTATPGSDITLYAVWADYSDKEAFTYELTSTTAGVANGVMTFFAPTSAHKSAEVYFANDDGIMDGYTPFVTVNFTKREEAYTVSGNRSFAMGATKLLVVFSGEGAENVVIEYDIPEEHRLANETPLYKYFVVSDLHLGGSANNIDYFYMQFQSTDPIRTRAFGGGSNNRQADVFNNGADFVIVNGDLVNYGSYDYGEETGEVGEERYWNVLDSFIEERLNNNNVPVFLTNGNHEFQKQNGSEQGLASFIPVRLESVINGQLDYITENYGDNVVITKDETNPDALYYAADMQGAKYIFMSTPEMNEDKTGSSKTVSAKQLKFVEEQLYDGENSGKTVFVITHLPITALTNADEVDALLANHPNAVVFNSHTHYNLGFDTHYTVVGDMTTSYTTSDTSATSYLATGVSNSYETGYNAGQFVEVYEDKIIIKGRKFADNSMFFGHALYIVETPDEGDIKSVAIDGTLAKDSTVTAVVNGSVPADDDSYSYEWIIAGETVSTEKSIKLTNAGVKVILRVTGADGSYASVLSDVVADYAPESYNVSSIRTDYYTGIRFKASVTKQQKEVAVEYGFIVTLKKLLGEKELNHDSGVKYVEGINYGVVDGKEVDKIHEIIGDDIFFTAVVYNIPKTQEAYTEEFVVRPFTKVEGTYYYGDSIERSVLSVAASLRDSNYKDLTAQAIETVKEILTVCGESTEAKE